MSLTDSILMQLKKKGQVRSSELVREFGISRQYIAKVLSQLVRENRIVKTGSTKSAVYATHQYIRKHTPRETALYSKTLSNVHLEEHILLDDIRTNFLPLLQCPDNIVSIFEYSFSEMMNNAIEHSSSKKIVFSVQLLQNILTFSIDDFGAGVFRNIMQKRKLQSEVEAIQDLMKGKITTAPSLHSGEGIFFTSKVSSKFTLESYGYQFIVDNSLPDVFIQECRGQKRGTKVTCSIRTTSKRLLNDVFRVYTDSTTGDFGFNKTEIQIRLFALGGVHISRSQARRVLSGLEKFTVIIMDYDRVPTVGQAFADEVYRVFLRKHPHIVIEDSNMNDIVQFMVRRARQESEIM